MAANLGPLARPRKPAYGTSRDPAAIAAGVTAGAGAARSCACKPINGE